MMTDIKKQEIRNLFRQGYKSYEIARALNLSEADVVNVLEKSGYYVWSTRITEDSQ